MPAINEDLIPIKTDPRVNQILKIAIMAVGGQGGGVLASWIETLCRSQRYDCQTTSVAGVSQRTGATIYYIETTPKGDSLPIFSLAPAAGDVDILIASEMMEVGRAIMRGFVTPDKTTLIGSTHRALAVSEKTVPGDGIADSAEVQAAAEIAAKTLLLLDLEQIAMQTNSVISASLFGALCASGALPFKRPAFEEAIRSSGKGVEPSIRAFELAINTIKSPEMKMPASTKLEVKIQPTGPLKLLNLWIHLKSEINLMPVEVQKMALLGLKKIVDFQNIKYGKEYINKLQEIIAKDSKKTNFEFSREAAKYLANAMSYDDLIRVADLKTRQSRIDRINLEMNVGKAMRLKLTEYFHPRAEEVVGLFPKNIGKWFEKSSKRMKLLDRLVNKGRRVKSTSLPTFLVLFSLGGLRSYRPKTWRHEVERVHREAWLEVAFSYLPKKYKLAVEIIKCRRLIKGYSDTHARGLSKFDRVLYGATLVAGRDDAAKWVDRLRQAALADENGEELEGALKTIQTIL